MKIFVDVGAHEGQTIEEVVKPEYGFDIIYALEPMPKQFDTLERNFLGDPRVKARNVGLGAANASVVMYGGNEQLEASIYGDKNDVDENIHTLVKMLDAEDFFRALPEGEVFVNMNCEGAELPILTHLIDSGAIDRIDYLLVDFDIRKIARLADREADLRFGLDASAVSWTCEYPVAETHQEMIGAWLRGVL